MQQVKNRLDEIKRELTTQQNEERRSERLVKDFERKVKDTTRRRDSLQLDLDRAAQKHVEESAKLESAKSKINDLEQERKEIDTKLRDLQREIEKASRS